MKPAVALADAVQVRRAGPDLLSLALIDARTRLLQALSVFEPTAEAEGAGATEARRLAAHAGWAQEWWIGRHVQRARGEAADPDGLRLASIHPEADRWFVDGPAGAVPDAATLRDYLEATLDITLDLLSAAQPDDTGLYVYRLALAHEDRLVQALWEAAAAAQRPAPAGQEAGPPPRPARDPLWLPAMRWTLGSTPGGWVPENERWGHEVAVPEFEIDAQPVDWQRFLPFAEDGGYDRREFWTEAGWAWLHGGADGMEAVAAASRRTAPRHVEQLRGAVLAQRHGRLVRLPLLQPAMHLSRHEAEAWCRWAGRRLPTEPEWELAAATAASRGFVWGEVFEWVAGSARAWPGHAPTIDRLDRVAEAAARRDGVLRGAAWCQAPRARHAKARRFASPGADGVMAGFRSCAV